MFTHINNIIVPVVTRCDGIEMSSLVTTSASAALDMSDLNTKNGICYSVTYYDYTQCMFTRYLRHPSHNIFWAGSYTCFMSLFETRQDLNMNIYSPILRLAILNMNIYITTLRLAK